MKLVIFGLTISSAWGNGHATLWRGLCRALAQRGHRPVFFERDVPYYARTRDVTAIPGGDLVLYPDWEQVRSRAVREVADADVAIVTSYCPDALAAAEILMEQTNCLRVFYDLDTPVTLEALEAGERVDYVGPRGLQDYELVLSYTGGAALDQLQELLGARAVAPLYGSVDPDVHHPVEPREEYSASLSYLGTYAADRQRTLDKLFLEAARRLREDQFFLAGSLYPQDFPWTANIKYINHVQPSEHSRFYCSSRLNLNITRGAMAKMGYCPSGRLFEAAACGAPILSDRWEGLERFFTPGKDILVASSTEEVIEQLRRSDSELRKIGQAARVRALQEHTAERRAVDLEQALQSVGAAVT